MAPYLARRTLGPIKDGMGGALNLDEPSFISVTQTNDITSIGSDAGSGNERTLFNTSEQGTTPTLTTNSESTDMTFTASGGTFVVEKDGNYYIEVTFICKVSTTTQYDVRVKVAASGGSAVLKHTKRIGSAATTDPDESTTGVVLSLNAGDTVTVTYEDDGTANIFPNLGTTVNIMRIGDVGGGVGGGAVTINNNTNGYFLTATGVANTLQGISQLQYNSTHGAISSSVDLYVSSSIGSDGIPGAKLFIQGTDADGNASKMRIGVENGFLKIIDDDLE